MTGNIGPEHGVAAMTEGWVAVGVGVVMQLLTGAWFLSRMKAETDQNAKQIAAFTVQVDRLRDALAGVEGKDGTTDFRLNQVEKNTEALRTVTGELNVFRGEVSANYKNLESKVDQAIRELAGMQRAFATLVSEGRVGSIQVFKQYEGPR